METLAKNRRLFIALSCASIASLVGSFAYPLQKLHIYRQVEKNALQQTYIRNFVLTENDVSLPWGFNAQKATLIGKLYQDRKEQKLILLLVSSLCALGALSIGQTTVQLSELDDEILHIKSTGKKQLLLESVKHRLAMASKSQRLLFLDEMKSLMDEFGSPEGEILEADELNAIASVEDEVEQVEEKGDSLDFRLHFPESLDSTSYKAVQKALNAGIDHQTIITDVLGCRPSEIEMGQAYLEYLLALPRTR